MFERFYRQGKSQEPGNTRISAKESESSTEEEGRNVLEIDEHD